jgi:hypothetical protein
MVTVRGKMDFTQPQETLSVNGFPLTFREFVLPGGRSLWVPRGISRNSEMGYWRLYVIHEAGLITRNIYDAPDALAGLVEAYQMLVDALHGLVSRFDVDKRQRAPGLERDPLIDTGFTGVTIARSSKRAGRRVEVHAKQMIMLPAGDIEVRSYYVGSIREEDVADDPAGQDIKLKKLLIKAVAARRCYNRQRSLGVYGDAVYRFNDVPADVRRQPVELPTLDIQAILDSFVAVPKSFMPATTGGDPVSLAVALQAHDLTKPHRRVSLEGRSLKFIERQAEGHTVYLPMAIYRARNEWRVRVAHTDGIFSDSVPDSDHGGSLLASLQSAWVYAVSLFRAFPPGRSRSFKQPLLGTGIPSLSVQPSCRVLTKTNSVRWDFSIRVMQTLDPQSVNTQVTGYWALADVTDDGIRQALRHGAAMLAYRQHRISSGEPVAQVLVDKDDVPAQFWPDEPVCNITADDLHYYAEQRTSGN